MNGRVSRLRSSISRWHHRPSVLPRAGGICGSGCHSGWRNRPHWIHKYPPDWTRWSEALLQLTSPQLHPTKVDLQRWWKWVNFFFKIIIISVPAALRMFPSNLCVSSRLLILNCPLSCDLLLYNHAKCFNREIPDFLLWSKYSPQSTDPNWRKSSRLGRPGRSSCAHWIKLRLLSSSAVAVSPFQGRAQAAVQSALKKPLSMIGGKRCSDGSLQGCRGCSLNHLY